MTESNDAQFDDFLDKGLTTLFERLCPVDGEQDAVPATEPLPAADETLPERLGEFRVIGSLGRGGVGEVYRIEDPSLGRDLAIKVLSRRYATDADLVARFVQEARVCSRLQHPGVVPIHELGRLDDGRPWFTMKIVQGDDLQALLRARRHPGDRRRRFLEIFEKVCQTVAFAHTHGVVHCDLKPANVMVGAFGEVQVMDWGFAREVAPAQGRERSASDDKSSRRVAGTPAYMAPEQARGDGDAPDARVDVFGLGAILCEILTGAPPYLGEDRVEVLLRASKGWLDDARARLRACGGDASLVALAESCMAADPGDRPSDAEVIARQVAEHLALAEQRAQELEVEAARAHARAMSERRVTRLAVGWSLTVVATLVLGTLGYLWMESDRRNDRERAEGAVRGAMERAIALRANARSFAASDPARWAEAMAAARQSAEFAQALVGESDLRARVDELAREVQIEHDSAVRDARIVEAIDEIWHDQFLGIEVLKLADTYGKAFTDWGVNVDRDSVDSVAAKIKASAIRRELSTALHDWAVVRKCARAESQHWEKLLEIADAADGDPVRQRLRRALRNDDVAELHAMAHSVDPANCDPETLDLLCSSLHACGELHDAIAVARRAFHYWPDSARLSHNLAVYLGQLGDDRPREEIVRVLSACVAVRPKSAHALTDFGLALAYIGEHEQSRVVLGRACEIAPSYSRAWTNAGYNELEAGRLGDAEYFYRRSVEVAPRDVSNRRGLGRVLELTQRDEAAVEEYTRLLGYAPRDTDSWIRLGLVQRRLGDAAAAEAAFRRAIEIDPDHARARCNLGLLLKAAGEYSEAAAQLRIGHELGVTEASWSHPSARWLEEAERLAASEHRLVRIADGEIEPLDPQEWVDAARHVHRLDRFSAALGVWRRVIADHPEVMSSNDRSHYYDAACAALLVADGQGDAPEMNEAERKACRASALEWLGRDLDLKERLFSRADYTGDPERILTFWHRDPDLDTVRGEATLPADEAPAWAELWKRHEALVRQARNR